MNPEPAPQTQSELSSSIPNENSSKKYLLIVGLIAAIVLFAVGAFWLYLSRGSAPQKQNQNSNTRTEVPSRNGVGLKQWVNCDDVREVIEEGNTLYVACLGGVLIVDKSSGKVLDQVTMRDGLRSATATALEKSGDTLYIGTQDGFAIFDTKTRALKAISEPEGLVNGSNITLALDGDTLWVGTFKGLSKYDTKTGKIENFTNELADNSTQVSSSTPLITRDALYFLVVANIHTAGSVARLDRATGTWERFGPAAFGKTDQYARIDMFDIEEVNGKVYVTDWRDIWEAENTKGATWVKRDDVKSQLSESESGASMNLIKLENNLGIISNNRVFSLDGNSLTKVYPEHPEAANVLTGVNDGISSVHNGKLWVLVGRYTDNWLRWVSIKDWKSGTIDLADRPKMISEIKALIDSTLIIAADGGVWAYDIQKSSFKKLVAFDALTTVEGDTFTFRPVAGTNKVFVTQQSCGMGCSEPHVIIYDYTEQSIKPVELSRELRTALGGEGEYGWGSLSYDSLDDKAKTVTLYAGAENKAILNLDTLTWAIKKETPPVQQRQESCNLYYSVKGKKFSEGVCTGALETSAYSWEIVKEGNDDRVYQTNKKTNERVKLTPPMDPVGYSPFEDWTFPYAIRQSAVVQGNLWLGSTRGLAMYDPEKSKWYLYEQKDGLLSNEGVSRFVVGENGVWVVTGWGGLSQIPRKD